MGRHATGGEADNVATLLTSAPSPGRACPGPALNCHPLGRRVILLGRELGRRILAVGREVASSPTWLPRSKAGAAGAP